MRTHFIVAVHKCLKVIIYTSCIKNKSALDNSPPPLLNLQLSRAQGQIIDVKCHCDFFAAINKLDREILISKMHKQIENVKLIMPVDLSSRMILFPAWWHA